MKRAIVSSGIVNEEDVVFVRQRARHVSELLGFDSQDQIRIATAVSELGRNAYQYAGGGKVDFALVTTSGVSSLAITVKDQGPGIPHLAEILGGNYHSKTGMGVGLVGAKRLMDSFSIEAAAGQGTAITVTKKLPASASVEAPDLKRISAALMADLRTRPLEEMSHQNRDLLAAVQKLQEKQDELNQINRELEETNRGVVALYAELDEKAVALSEANSIKTRFLSSVTHEFRSPIMAMTNLTGLLLNEADGPLSPGQQKQIRLIRKSLESLGELVNDLLDLAKVEAGKVPIRTSSFELQDVIGGLRGLFRNVTPGEVTLSLEDPVGIPHLFTDEGKVSQILRNLLSNALKYTSSGSVKLYSGMRNPDTVVITVADTGIGIAPENLGLVFEEFVQIESALQAKTKGTGLGLSLSKKLAELLGGKIELSSELGHGSEFSLVLPTKFHGPSEGKIVTLVRTEEPAPARESLAGKSVLLIDDREEERYVLKSYLASTFRCEVREAASGSEGLAMARKFVPSLIFLDLVMPDLSGFDVLTALRREPSLDSTKVVIYSGNELSVNDRVRLAQASDFISKTAIGEEELMNRVKAIGESTGLSAR